MRGEVAKKYKKKSLDRTASQDSSRIEAEKTKAEKKQKGRSSFESTVEKGQLIIIWRWLASKGKRWVDF